MTEENTTTTCVDVTTGGETSGFWTIQNSWSSNWGDNGFMHIEYTPSGYGVCGINRVMQWVTVV